MEVGYSFHPEFWGRGLATEIATTLVLLGQGADGVPYHRRGHDADNEESQQVLVKAGLEPAGDIDFTGVAHSLFRLRGSSGPIRTALGLLRALTQALPQGGVLFRTMTVSAAATERVPRQSDVDAFGLTDTGKMRPANADQFLILTLHKMTQVQASSLPTEIASSQTSDARGVHLPGGGWRRERVGVNAS